MTGIPIVVAGFTGSLMVISVNAWMNHPAGFRLRDGKVVDVHPLSALFGNSYLWHELMHMYVAGYIVMGFLVAAAYGVGRLRGRWGRYERTAFAIPLTIAALAAPVQVLVGDWAGREVATYQPTKLAAIEGLGHTTKGADEHLLGWYTRRRGQVRDRDPARCSRCSRSTAGTRPSRASTPSRQPTGRPSTSCGSRSRRWWGSARCWRSSGCSSSYVRIRRRRLPESRVVLPGGDRRRAGGRSSR